jgi:hypothetical protein
VKVEVLQCDVCGTDLRTVEAAGGNIEPIQIGSRRIDMCSVCRSEKSVVAVELAADANGVEVDTKFLGPSAIESAAEFQRAWNRVMNFSEQQQARKAPALEIPPNASDKEISQIVRDHREKWVNQTVEELMPELIVESPTI